ncbi:MAG: hypothetical protein K5872_14770 [Rhizobiaceae bacterium]|nr:hypothetical protein [Rhizobiaceae bacterium]MCV0407484.1 hypothetical protein [Rhizobiaceae bacterium]
MVENRRETGARALKPAPHRPRTDQNAALPKKPKPYGLTRKPDETEKKARHSEGVDLSDEGERDE